MKTPQIGYMLKPHYSGLNLYFVKVVSTASIPHVSAVAIPVAESPSLLYLDFLQIIHFPLRGARGNG